MSYIELFILSVGLSMDAFAVAICAGLSMSSLSLRKAFNFSIYIGGFHAVMPLAGYLVASVLSETITGYDHWIAFSLLGFLGGRMIVGSFRKESCSDRECPAEICTDRTCPTGKRPNSTETSLNPAQMIPLALATSIDSLAIGVSFAFLHVEIVPAVSMIGLTTLFLAMIGVKLGNVFGAKFKSKAEFAGGFVLVLIGLKTLLEHLSIISF
jgi:putative Mn2+ efflux pump MntP